MNVGCESGGRREHVLRTVDPGEHERGRDAGAVGAEDVGVEPVAEEERMLRPEPRDGLIEDRHLGLARDGREAADRGVHGGDERAVSRRDAPRLRDRPVGVGGDPGDAALFLGHFSAYAASASCVQPTSGAKPCTTAAGASSALRVTTKPAFSTSLTSPSPPTTSTVEPGRDALDEQAHRGLRARDDLVGRGRRDRVRSGAPRPRHRCARRCS